MTSSDLEEAAASQLEKLAELVRGRAGGVPQGKPRIYLRRGVARGRSVYFAFPDFPSGDAVAPLGGAALKIYIDDCAQTPRWYASQKRQEAVAAASASLALSAAAAGEWELAEKITACDADWTESEMDTAGRHLLNGRFREAAEALGLCRVTPRN